MTTRRRNRCSLCVLFLIVAGLAGPAFAARPPATKDLLADLRRALATPAASPAEAKSAGSRYADALDLAIAQGRYGEAEHALNQLRQTVPAGNEKAAALLEQLQANVRAELTAAAAKYDAAYAVIERDFVASVEAKAPPPAFDALLQRLSSLPPGAAYLPGGTGQKAELLRTFIVRWQDYLMHSARGNVEQAAQALSDLVQQSGRLPIIPRSQLASLQADTVGRVSNRSDLIELRLAALQKQLAATIDSATGPADFDALFVELAKPLPGEGVPSRSGNHGSQLETLRRFASRWQDYFSQVQAGKTGDAQAILRELSTNNAYDSLYPRSQLLARLNGNAPPPPPEVVARAVESLLPPGELTVDTIGQLLQQLMPRRSPPVVLPGGEDLVVELVLLRDHVAALNAGNYLSLLNPRATFGGSQGRVGPYRGAIAAIKAGLVLRAMALHAAAPPEIQPAPADNVASYAQKLVAYGRQKRDWNYLYRVLLIQQTMSGPSADLAPDLMAFQYLLAGSQHETAGLWSQAIRSYIFALSVGAPNLPAEEVGTRLKRLSLEHPAEYAREKDTFVSLNPQQPGNYTERRSGSEPAPPLAIPKLPAPELPAANAAPRK